MLPLTPALSLLLWQYSLYSSVRGHKVIWDFAFINLRLTHSNFVIILSSAFRLVIALNKPQPANSGRTATTCFQAS